MKESVRETQTTIIPAKEDATSDVTIKVGTNHASYYLPESLFIRPRVLALVTYFHAGGPERFALRCCPRTKIVFSGHWYREGFLHWCPLTRPPIVYWRCVFHLVCVDIKRLLYEEERSQLVAGSHPMGS